MSRFIRPGRPAQTGAAALLVLAATASAAIAAGDLPARTSTARIGAATRQVDGDFIRKNAATTHDWPSHGLDYAETRFSRLGQVNAGNVKELGLVWSYNLESRAASRRRHWWSMV